MNLWCSNRIRNGHSMGTNFSPNAIFETVSYMHHDHSGYVHTGIPIKHFKGRFIFLKGHHPPSFEVTCVDQQEHHLSIEILFKNSK